MSHHHWHGGTLGANLLRPREAILRIANLLCVNLAERNQKRQNGRRQGSAGLRGRALGDQGRGRVRVRCSKATTRSGNTKSRSADL